MNYFINHEQRLTLSSQGTLKPNAAHKCNDCEGEGHVTQMRTVGFGLLEQIQVPCNACNARGEFIDEADRCATCHGNKTVEEKKTLEVFVEKGMKDGAKLVFDGMADHLPGLEPGDVVLVLQTQDHPVFKRAGDDLFVEKKIKLSEALCGLAFAVPHLDGRVLWVSTLGQVLKPGEIKVVEAQGMPLHRDPYSFGKLYIKFDVEFPEPQDLSPPVIEVP
jgi:DnaJ homolog subfamily A member 2